RYKEKDRSQRALNRQLHAAKTYVFTNGFPSNATFTLRLLWTVLELQDCNHSGDPRRAQDVAREYLLVRDEAFLQDSRLVGHVDCNLAVHYCDRLDFFAAERVLLTLRQDQAFHSFDLLQKAVIESSLGQVASMQRYRNADWHFGNALAFLDKADLTDA